jgi:hypothetical protein
MRSLKKIQFTLPSSDRNFAHQFINYLSLTGVTTTNTINLTSSMEQFFPKTSFLFVRVKNPSAVFIFDNNDEIKVDIANTTNVSKQSPYHYSHIALDEFVKRMAPFPLIGLDHTGFNLPYFEGIHPKILTLREKLKNTCLYHTFPKHLADAPWDFIIPGTEEEIRKTVQIDYNQMRKPKVEIVSFENSSTPLIQIDIQIEGKYENLVKVFPEAIHVPKIRNMWIYIKNDFGIDVCFVLNEVSENDWSYQFKNDRLL